MVSNLPYTLQDLQERINSLVNNDTDTPVQNDDDWNLVNNLINQSIGKWESQDVQWDELFTSFTVSPVVTNGVMTYSLSSLTNLKKLGGFLKLTLNGQDTYVEFISPEVYQSLQQEERVAYVTGNEVSGYTLNLGWEPATGDGMVGATMSFPYYKFATRFNTSSATTDKTEMSDPNFIIYDVAAAKSLMESKNNQYSVYANSAAECMDRMRILNEVTAPYNDGAIDDIYFINHNAILGE